MSLMKKRTVTAKRRAANQANATSSHGPTTAEGRERIRDANLRHGFYSQEGGKALRALGEKPEDFDAVVRAVMEKYPPSNSFEELLAMCLARALWGMDRGHRMQEGYALRQAKDVNNNREDRQHAHMMRLKMAAASLQSLAQSVAHEHYVTTPADLDLMKSLQKEGEVKEMGEIALALFLQLREPGQYDEEGRHIDPNEMGRRALVRIKQIFGLDTDVPPRPRTAPVPGQPPANPPPAPPPPEVVKGPQLTAAQWEAREPVRQLLEHILTRQAEICEAQRMATLRETLKGPSPYERAAEIAPTHENVRLMRRMQDANFREVWRITNLLLKIKRQAQEEEGFRNP